jgi:hypothetical protein
MGQGLRSHLSFAKVCSLAALCMLCGAVALTAVPRARAATVDIFLQIGCVQGECDYTHSRPCDVGTCLEIYNYQFSAACATCGGLPSQGDFELSLVGRAFDPCLAKRVSGSLTFVSTDPLYPPETTVTSVFGRSRDHKGFVVDGTVSSGAFAGYSGSVFASVPPNPCESGDFTATVALYAPKLP